MSTDGTPVRDLAIGIGTGMGAIALVFFGSAAAVEVATLVLAVAMLIWFATAPVSRIVDAPGRPSLMLFGLAALGLALMGTAAIFLGTLTVYLSTALVTASIVVGLVRGLGRPPQPPGREE